MSRWKKISLAVLIVILLLIGSVTFLVGTASGLSILINAANRWVPGLKIDSVTGGWQDLTLKNIRYDQPGVEVKAGQVHLSVSLSCLWHSRLCVNDVSLADVDVAIDTQKMPPSEPVTEEESGPLNLATPYPLTLSHASLKNIHLKIDDTTVDVTDFSSGLQWVNSDLTLTPTELNGLLIALPKTPPLSPEQLAREKAQAAAQPAEPLGEQLAKLFSTPFLPAMPDFKLPLNFDIQSFKAANLRLTGDTELLVHSLLLKASSQDGQVKLETLDVDSSQGTIAATGSAELQHNWPVNLHLDSTLNIDPLKGEKVKISINGALREALNVGLTLSGPLEAELQGQTQLAEAGLPLNLKVSSRQLYWPLSGEKAYQADNVELQLSGKMTDYALSLKSQLKGEDLPATGLALKGKGNVQQFNLDNLELTALQGKAELKGVVDWSKAISWRSELTLSGINTSKQYPEWPAKLAGKIVSRGSLYGGSWQLDLPEINLTGDVKKNPIKVEGQVRGNNYMQWDIPGLHIQLGRNKADITGEFGEKNLKLDANLNAPNLDNLLPGLGGTILGSIKVRGDIDAPQLVTDLSANKLRFQALTIGKIALKGDIVSREQIGGDLALRVENIRQPDVNISLVTLGIKGNEKQHSAQLRVQGEPVSGRLDVSGSFDRSQQRWTGKISNTRFETPIGPWTLSRDMTLDLRSQEQQLAIGPHCWLNPNAEVCMSQTINLGPKGNAIINLNRLDLAMLKPVMPENTQASGIFTGKADFTWDTDASGLPQGQLTLDGKGVNIRQNVDGKILPIRFEALRLNASLKNNLAQLGWLIHLANNGQFDGQVSVTDPQNKRNLGGSVNIRGLSLDLINSLFTRGEKAQGVLNANLRLGGNAQQPQLFGQMQLNNLDIEGNFMPFEMQPSQIALQFNGMSSILQGTLRTRQGQIVLDGDADWSTLNNWRARIGAKGDKVRITVPPMVRLDVSPDVEFIATPSLFTLNGRVDIPWARITVHDLPESAVGVSSDEVMLDASLQPIQPKTASIPINSNLSIHVGDNVRLDAFGLKARLTGNLAVMQDKQGLGLNGQISIPQGRFRAYGQDLIVRKGELLFSGPPEQPYINLEAIRNPDATENNVIAGVRVTGLAPEPKAEIFSDPAMSQQEALSYLLRGQGLSATGNDGDVMTSMLVGLGVAQSGQIVGKIGETFGVSNLTLDTAGVGDSSQVVVSGYVLPGLQVKYGVGIFDSLATLTLRYRLMPKLYLEAVSGIDQALDLLYQFEF